MAVFESNHRRSAPNSRRKHRQLLVEVMERRVLLSLPSVNGPSGIGPPASADLSIAISANPNSVFVGQSLTYTVTVTNRGPSDAVGVIVTDQLPANVELNSASDSQGALPVLNGSVLTAALGTIPASKTAIVTIVITPKALPMGGLIDTVSVTSQTPDPSPADNSAQITTIVKPVAVLVPWGPRRIRRVGQPLTYESRSRTRAISSRRSGGDPILCRTLSPLCLRPR